MIPNNRVTLNLVLSSLRIVLKIIFQDYLILKVVMVVWPVTTFMYGPIKRLEEHLVDALVQRGDEGRDTLR